MKRLCLIGFGRWGKVHLAASKVLKNAKITCVVSRHFEDSKSEYSYLAFYKDFDDAVDAETIDAVIIASSPIDHYEYAKKCAENHLPFLIEKPFTLSYKDSKEITDLVIREDLACMVSYLHLFSLGYSQMKQDIKQHEENLEISSNFFSNGPVRDDISVIRDWGSHDLAMCLDILGYDLYDDIGIAQIEKLKNQTKFHGTYKFTLDFHSNNKFKICVSNNSTIEKHNFSVKAKKNIYRYYGDGSYISFFGKNTQKKVCVASENELPLQLTHKRFIDLLDSKKKKNFDSLKLASKVNLILDNIENLIEY